MPTAVAISQPISSLSTNGNSALDGNTGVFATNEVCFSRSYLEFGADFDRQVISIVANPSFAGSTALCKGFIINVDEKVACTVLDGVALYDFLSGITEGCLHDIAPDSYPERDSLALAEPCPIHRAQIHRRTEHIKHWGGGSQECVDFDAFRGVAERAHADRIIPRREKG